MSILGDKCMEAGLPVYTADDEHVSFSRTLTEVEEETFINILQPQRLAQIARKAQASQTAKAIPAWARWTQVEANTWANTNIATPLANARANLPATLTLPIVRAALLVLLGILDRMWELQRANAQMTLALRDEIWPDLENK